MDVHIRRAVTSALRLRSVDVLTAQEDGATQLDDDLLLQRATELGRVLVSQDEDLLREGAHPLRDGTRFSGAEGKNVRHCALSGVRCWCGCHARLRINRPDCLFEVS